MSLSLAGIMSGLGLAKGLWNKAKPWIKGALNIGEKVAPIAKGLIDYSNDLNEGRRGVNRSRELADSLLAQTLRTAGVGEPEDLDKSLRDDNYKMNLEEDADNNFFKEQMKLANRHSRSQSEIMDTSNGADRDSSSERSPVDFFKGTKIGKDFVEDALKSIKFAGSSLSNIGSDSNLKATASAVIKAIAGSGGGLASQMANFGGSKLQAIEAFKRIIANGKAK